MVFDWFRRKYNQPEETAQEAIEPGSKPEQPTESGGSAPASEDPEASSETEGAEDYLAWAKAAYQNLKQ